MINQVQSKLNPGYAGNNRSQDRKNVSFGMARLVIKGEKEAIKAMARNTEHLSNLHEAARGVIGVVKQVARALKRDRSSDNLIISFNDATLFKPAPDKHGRMVVTLTRTTKNGKPIGNPQEVDLSEISLRNLPARLKAYMEDVWETSGNAKKVAVRNKADETTGIAGLFRKRTPPPATQVETGVVSDTLPKKNLIK